MPWEWKEEQPVSAPVVRYGSKDQGTLAAMVWVVLGASVFLIIGFGLLIGYSSNIVRSVYTSGGVIYSEVANSAGGYVAGIVLFSLAAVTCFATGIALLAVRKPHFQDQGLVTATGIISILGGLLFVSFVLSIVLLSRIYGQKKYGANVPPPPYAVPPPPQAAPVAPPPAPPAAPVAQ